MADAAAEDEFFESETLVFCIGPDVVGFVSWNDDYLTWLYVDPAHHRQGIGRGLLEAALPRIGPDAWTNTIPENLPALALYQAVGMELVRIWPSSCDGYPCNTARLALPTSRMRSVEATREPSSELMRFRLHVREWEIEVENSLHTDSSIVAFGRCSGRAVVLKFVRRRGDEWRSGEVLEAFSGRGTVRSLQCADGAALLERLSPGAELGRQALSDSDATTAIADVIARMSPGSPPADTPTVETWGGGFERYTSNGLSGIPRSLVEVAHRIYMNLCATQTETRLLHGDLHHGNVLSDARLGWVAIDPKGVVGELAYETGAALRNPSERPELFARPEIIEERIACFSQRLSLDPRRILAWGFAQAVLAAIWELEDDGLVAAGHGWIAFAEVAMSMLDGTKYGCTAGDGRGWEMRTGAPKPE